MNNIALILIVSLLSLAADAQYVQSKRFSFGIEQDLLPYATGGYFAGIWAGRNHVRVRSITAKVNKPAFIVKDGFVNNKVTAYALLSDFFIKENWKGWWAGTGLVYWESSIQTTKRIITAHYNNWLVNGSVGYNFFLGKRLYVSPWCGMHLRVGGNKHVNVDEKIFKPALLNPEGSIKLGLAL